MITIKIEIPHKIVEVMTTKMLMGNYIEPDPRVKLLKADEFKGLCKVEVNSKTDWEKEITDIFINAKYYSEEQELLTLLSM